MMRDTGLSADTISKLVEEILKCRKVNKIILYGSRAKGTFRTFSDIDITLIGDDLKREELYPILERIDDLYLPYEIDLSIYAEIDYQPLKEEIDRYGVELY